MFNPIDTMKRVPLVLFLLFAISPLLFPSSFVGRVVGVSDGDTIKVMHQGQAEKVRLGGIDSPERGQPFEYKAKQFVSDLCFGKDVTVLAKGQGSIWTHSSRRDFG